ncbi:transcriptional regulator FilR1 domain-containing protein [Halobaculum saliterrae]|uniref:transcriptional regulator FilR1 domain-containing protein n=1 Tax=Halobaculum saliterrae TaxID=2073113 RepID=UPI00374413E1
MSRKAIYRRIREFREIGFAIDGSDGEVRMTRSAVKAIGAYRCVAAQTDPAAIAYLTNSESRRDLLRTLVATSADKAELAADEQLPSRSTVHRTLDRLDDLEWVDRTTDGRFTATSRAVVDLERIDWLVEAIRQAIAKAPALRRMSYWVDPPLHALAGGDLVVETPTDPNALLSAAVDAADLRTEGLSHVRSITPVFDPVMLDLFGNYIDRDTTQQIVFDRRTYRQLTRPGRIHYLAGAVLAPNVEVRIHPEPLYTGLAIYNRETVMVGGSTRHTTDAAVVGAGAALRRWADTTFENIWADSQRPAGRIRGWLDRAVSSPLG